MSLPDYRIRFPAPLIDFAADVGLTGQAHDNYPEAGAQARFDHLRLYLIGLLSNQASFITPTEHSDGTIWFDLSENYFKTFNDNKWRDIADNIVLRAGTDTISLSDWYQNQASVILNSLAPEVVFGGRCSTAGLSRIPIPSDFTKYIKSDSRIFLTVNGISIDSREVRFIQVGIQKNIDISPSEFDAGDVFFVSIRRIPNETYYTESIII
jgi:hypothetical protein